MEMENEMENIYIILENGNVIAGYQNYEEARFASDMLKKIRLINGTKTNIWVEKKSKLEKIDDIAIVIKYFIREDDKCKFAHLESEVIDKYYYDMKLNINSVYSSSAEDNKKINIDYEVVKEKATPVHLGYNNGKARSEENCLYGTMSFNKSITFCMKAYIEDVNNFFKVTQVVKEYLISEGYELV